MTRPPIEVRDSAGVLVAKITRTSRPKSPTVRGRRAMLQLIVLLVLWKLVAWLLFLTLVAR